MKPGELFATFHAAEVFLNNLTGPHRVRAEHDYKINLKAELEIRHLHEKLDHLLK